MASQLQASRLIPAHIFTDLGQTEKQAQVQVEGSDVSVPAVSDFLDFRLPANLQSCIRIQPQAFSAETYKIEPSVEFKTEKGVLTTKTCPVVNFIRHKYINGKDTEPLKGVLAPSDQTNIQKVMCCSLV